MGDEPKEHTLSGARTPRQLGPAHVRHVVGRSYVSSAIRLDQTWPGTGCHGAGRAAGPMRRCPRASAARHTARARSSLVPTRGPSGLRAATPRTRSSRRFPRPLQTHTREWFASSSDCLTEGGPSTRPTDWVRLRLRPVVRSRAGAPRARLPARRTAETCSTVRSCSTSWRTRAAASDRCIPQVERQPAALNVPERVPAEGGDGREPGTVVRRRQGAGNRGFRGQGTS